MSLRSAPFYWLECDNCGARADYGGFIAMADPGSATGMAAGWSHQGEQPDDRHHCPDCPVIADCERCGKDAGELPGERDYHCRACWDLPGAGDAARVAQETTP